MDRFREARDRGGCYLLRQLHADGSFGSPEAGVADYYKVPAALQVCGETAAAHRLCDWIRHHGLMENGDFGPRPRFARDYFYAYFNAWVVIGAARLGQFDLANRGMDFLMEFNDSESGGFYSSPHDRRDFTRQDLWVVSGCGQAALYTGRSEAAQQAGRWIQRLMDAQPAYPEKLYTVYSRSAGLHLEAPAAGSRDAGDDDDRRYCLVNAAAGDQYFFHPGIAGGFLSMLYLASGERQWLALARQYMRFAELATPHLLTLLRAGKVAWAASLLYTVTAEPVYRNLATTIGDNIIAQQHEDGCWGMAGMSSNDATAEMVYWMDQVHQAVGG